MIKCTTRLSGKATLRSQPRKATAATELAIVLPLLLLVFTVTLDFARIYQVTQTLDNCAFAGAMYASGTAWTPATTSTAATAAQNAACAEGASLIPPLQPQNVSVQQNAATVVVTIEYNFSFITPMFNRFQPLSIFRTVTMTTAPTPGN